jgi:hypothetical protein
MSTLAGNVLRYGHSSSGGTALTARHWQREPLVNCLTVYFILPHGFHFPNSSVDMPLGTVTPSHFRSSCAPFNDTFFVDVETHRTQDHPFTQRANVVHGL